MKTIIMKTKRPELVTDEIYHVVLRGTGDSLIFKDENDYFRMIFSLFEFNTTKPIEIREQRKLRKFKGTGGLSTNISETFREQSFLVEILAFCFMPNHIHLLLRQIREKGITDFMRKVGTGYAGYFNKKYCRRGHLFQGRFQVVHIENDDQLKTVFVYIHTNPISLVEPGWKEKGIKNLKKIIKFLKSFKWSSYLDYLGKKNFPSVTKRDFILEIMGGPKGCLDAVNDWLEYKKEVKQSSILLE